MDERVRDTFLLCQSLLEYLPSPRGSLETVPGLVEGKRVPCGACAARGRVVGERRVPCSICAPRLGPLSPPPHHPKHGCQPCLLCDGTGWRRSRRGDAAFDEYAGGLAVQSAAVLVDTNRQLDRASFLLRLWTEPEAIEEAWEEKRKNLWRMGSYHELTVALGVVRDSTPGRFSLVWRSVILGQTDFEVPARSLLRLSEGSLKEVNATLYYMAYDLMPTPIRVPFYLKPERANKARKNSLWRGRTVAHRKARRERDEEILRQRDELGWKIARIAKYHAIDERRVKQIVSEGRKRAGVLGAGEGSTGGVEEGVPGRGQSGDHRRQQERQGLEDGRPGRSDQGHGRPWTGDPFGATVGVLHLPQVATQVALPY